jgi:hypothetical protein
MAFEELLEMMPIFLWSKQTPNIFRNVWNGFPECFALQKQSRIS